MKLDERCCKKQYGFLHLGVTDLMRFDSSTLTNMKYLFILLFIISLMSCSDVYYSPTPEPFVIHTYRVPGPYFRPAPPRVHALPPRGPHFMR